MVYDQSTGETVRDPLQNVAGMSDVRDGKDAAVMYALDGDLAYVKTQQGAAAWNTATGDLTFLDTEANGFTITDAKNGLIVLPAGRRRGRASHLRRRGPRQSGTEGRRCGRPTTSPPTADT